MAGDRVPKSRCGSLRSIAAAVCWSAPPAALVAGAGGSLLATSVDDVAQTVRLAMGAGAVVVVIAAAGFASGLLALAASSAGEGPRRRVVDGFLLAGLAVNAGLVASFGPAVYCLLR